MFREFGKVPFIHPRDSRLVTRPLRKFFIHQVREGRLAAFDDLINLKI